MSLVQSIVNQEFRIDYSTDSVGDLRDQIRKVGGDELMGRIKPVYGLDSEGEITGAWRNFGVPNMWYILGQFYRFSFDFRDDDNFFFLVYRQSGALSIPF